MFIPRGRIIHDNLATRYIMLEALVEDMRESGFSGVVEVSLQESNGYIVFAGGKVESMIERSGESYNPATLTQLAESSRLERGRVDVYAYSATSANAIAGRINGQTLYAGLSAEFADPEKIIRKLAREPDCEWFIEINAGGEACGLIHIRDGRCRIFSSVEDAVGEEAEAADLAGNLALGKLLFECRRAGGTFDVCFSRAGEAPAAFGLEETAAAANSGPLLAPGNQETSEATPADSQGEAPRQLSAGDVLVDQIPEGDSLATPGLRAIESVEATGDHPAQTAASRPNWVAEGEDETFAAIAVDFDPRDLTFAGEDLGATSPDETMTEIKRLMAEIARSIEEAAQSVGPHDRFSMCLRGSQIKIADRYPFLDPFAGEFEYLAGEIVFVGEASAEEFAAGFSEALKLAVDAVMQSAAYPDRFRSYVAEDLRKLLARNRPELERFGLDQAVEHILSSL